MENSRYSTSESVIPQTSQSGHRLSSSLFQRIRLLYSTFIRYFVEDWQGRKYIFFAALLLLLTVLSIMFYYLNYPQIELNPDTPAYLHVVQRIQTHPYWLVDTWRLPVYPLLIIFTYIFAGQGNLTAVSIVQAGLFILTTLEIYCIACLLLRRAWLAFLIGLLVGTNIVMLSYIKPIMSEGLAMFLLTTLVLAILYFLRTLRVRHFWLVVLCYLPLLFTRPEWEYLPIPLFAYLLLIAVRRGVWHHLLRHMVLALVLIYALVGMYIGINTFINHYPGFTAIENFNWLGKVLQYHMWNEASPQYAQDSKQLSICVAHIDTDPYHVLPCVPSLSHNDNVRAGAFARDIILHHPVEFFLKSAQTFFSSLTTFYNNYPSKVSGNYEWTIGWLKVVQRWLYNVNALFTPCAITWFFLLLWRRTRKQQIVLEVGAIVLIVFYALAITTLGGYRFDDYMRVHTVFDPLLILIIWVSVFLGVQYVWVIVMRYWRHAW